MRRVPRPGFTLIEIMIVVSLMAIVSAIALPRLHISGFRADAGMRAVQATLQQAQRSAVVRQTDVMVSFDTAGRRVRIVFDANGNHNYDPGEEIHWRALEDGVRFRTPPSGVQTAGGAPVVGSAIVSRDNYPTVFYHRDGALSSELELFIQSARPDLADFRALHVTQSTGRVRLYQYTGAAWMAAGL
jgi:prepilin-type N-terminal cleavage/methylation domain-containing protein